MNTQIIIDEFNTKLFEFINQLHILCTNMNNNCVKATDIQKLQTLTNIDKEFVIKLYIKQIIIYKQKIDNYDHSLFEQFDIKSLQISDININFINKYLLFSKLFKKLNPDNKKIIFDYLQVLSAIADKYTLN